MATNHARNRDAKDLTAESRYRDPTSAPPPGNHELPSSQNSMGHAATEPLTNRTYPQKDERVKKFTVIESRPFAVEKTIVFNRYNCRTFTKLLEECCEKLGTSTYVKSLRTHSGRSAHSLDEIQHNKKYIAICSNKRGRQFQPPRLLPNRLPPLRPDALPSRRNRQFANVPCRLFDEDKFKTMIVHVYCNGVYRCPAKKVLVDNRCQKQPRPIDYLLRIIEDRVHYAAKKIYSLDTRKQIHKIEDIHNNMTLVVTAANEHLKLQEEYGNVPSHFIAAARQHGDFGQAPQVTRLNHQAPLPAISRSRRDAEEDTHRGPRSRSTPSRTKLASRSSVELNGAPSPAPPKSPRAPRKSPAAPAAPKSPKTPPKAPAPPKAPKVAAKAPKAKKKQRKGESMEVQEDENTRTELPVEQQKAEEVEDEPQPSSAQPTDRAASQPAAEEHKEAEKDPETGADPKPEEEAVEDSKAEEAAATKIQAGFRGYKTRKDLKDSKGEEAAADEEKKEEKEKKKEEEEEKKEEEEEEEKKEEEEEDDKKKEEEAATKIQAGFRGYKTRKDLKGEEKKDEEKEEEKPEVEEEKKEEEPEEEERKRQEAAATKIQAGYRGHMVRKDMKAKPEENGEANEEEEKPEEEKKEEEEEEDDEKKRQEAAATKIQAGYRGHMVRKDMKAKPEENGAPNGDGEEEEKKEEKEEDKEKKEEEEAATKIQANFRGYKARKEVGAMKEQQNGAENGAEQAAAENEVDAK